MGGASVWTLLFGKRLDINMGGLWGVLGALGAVLEASWALLGALEASWALLGRSWTPLGRVLGVSWALLERT